VAANRPAGTPAPAEKTHEKKVGFFRRIGRLFGSR
jgi:ATP-dependent RNA helicase RhlB